MTSKKKSKKKKVKKKEDWSEILFSTSELTYYDLIVEENRIIGAWGVNYNKGTLVAYSAKEIILATVDLPDANEPVIPILII